MNSPKHNLLNAAYLYYYATEVVFKPGAEQDGSFKERLMQLIADALIIADQSKFDVFNSLTLMDNVQFITDLKVGLVRSLVDEERLTGHSQLSSLVVETVC